jgi:hypothetical protein
VPDLSAVALAVVVLVDLAAIYLLARALVAIADAVRSLTRAVEATAGVVVAVGAGVTDDVAKLVRRMDELERTVGRRRSDLGEGPPRP